METGRSAGRDRGLGDDGDDRRRAGDRRLRRVGRAVIPSAPAARAAPRASYPLIACAVGELAAREAPGHDGDTGRPGPGAPGRTSPRARAVTGISGPAMGPRRAQPHEGWARRRAMSQPPYAVSGYRDLADGREVGHGVPEPGDGDLAGDRDGGRAWQFADAGADEGHAQQRLPVQGIHPSTVSGRAERPSRRRRQPLPVLPRRHPGGSGSRVRVRSALRPRLSPRAGSARGPQGLTPQVIR
ncbi:hypothetical protein GA0115240_147030 [Streptomyces sp. DvalAA-14]|nr:hypothetical protein GA0115240_147030 [Streptomyces sp. DvalAA-14]